MQHGVHESLLGLLVDISTLTPDPKNRRKHPERSIAEIVSSYQANGQRKPIIVQRIADDGTPMVVRAGNGQLEAMKRMGWTHTAAVVVDEKDREAIRFALQDNRAAEFSEWDFQGLREELAGMQQAFDFDTASLGWSGGEVIEMLASIDDPRPSARPSRKRGKNERQQVIETVIPEPPTVTVTRPGDVWTLGRHVVVCGDCTVVDAKSLAIGDVGFGFTSPPYNAKERASRLAGREFGKGRSESRYMESDGLTDEQYLDLLVGSTRLMLAVCKIAAVNIQSIANNKRVLIEWQHRLIDHFVDRYVWVKTGSITPQLAANVANSMFEDVFIFSPEKGASRAISTGDFKSNAPNVHQGPGVRGNAYADVHNATMPSHLAEWMIGVFGEKADFVVEPFGGTGTTMMVCEQLGKRCASVELDPRYCDIMVERWQNFTGRKAERSRR